MKTIFVVMMICAQSVFALDLGDVQGQGAKLAEQAKAKAQDVMVACKEDKVKHCEKYNKLDALKECLKKNKEALTDGCKASLGLK